MITRQPDASLRYGLRIPQRGTAAFLRRKVQGRARTLFAIAESMYEFELMVKAQPQHTLTIGLEEEAAEPSKAEALGRILERLVSYVLLVDAEIVVVREDPAEDLDPSEPEESKPDAACLFSGGVDSLSGILWAEQRYGRCLAVFCAHAQQPHMVSTVRALSGDTFRRQHVEYVEMPAPAMTISGYSQLRGFFYILAGAAAAIARGVDLLVVSECGPTMYQPRFAATDQVTMTTHPFVVQRALEVVRLIGSPTFKVETPFEDRTKAEVVALCAEKERLPVAHSCISQRLGTHDGTCFGCVVRRLATLAAGVADTSYVRDPLRDESASAGNLLALLDFSAQLLVEPDQIPGFQRELIDDYAKWDLFERFALDNLAAVHRLTIVGGPLASAVAQTYQFVVGRLGGTARLDTRLAFLGELSDRTDSRGVPSGRVAP